jgi:hypothetical protein
MPSTALDSLYQLFFGIMEFMFFLLQNLVMVNMMHQQKMAEAITKLATTTVKFTKQMLAENLKKMQKDILKTKSQLTYQ